MRRTDTLIRKHSPEDQTARSIVALTRSATRRHRTSQWSSRIADAYTALLTIGFLAVLATSSLSALRNQFTTASTIIRTVTEADFRTLPSTEGLAALYLIATVAALMFIGRTGPIGVRGAAGFWWLSLPVRRSSMLVVPTLRSLASVVGLFELVYIPTLILSSRSLSVELVLLSIGSVACCATVVFLVALAAQIMGKKDHLDKLCVFMLVVSSASLYLHVLLASHGLHLNTLASFFTFAPPNWPLLVTQGYEWAALASIGAAIIMSPFFFMFERLGRVELLASGSKASHVGASLFLLNMRQIAYAFSSEGLHRRHVATRFMKGRRASLVAAQLEYFVRSRGKLPSLFILAVLPSATPAMSGVDSPLLSGVVLLICGASVALIASYPLQLMTEVPGLARLFPFSTATLRRLAACSSAVVVCVWALTVILLTILLGACEYIVPVLVLAVPGLVGCSLSAAYTDDENEAVGIALGMFGSAMLALGCMAPVLITLLAGVAVPVLLFAQVISSAGALWWGLRVPPQRVILSDINS